MASLNRCTFIARLGKDPEVRYTASGTAVASFSGAVSEKFKNKSGEVEEKTEWINFTAWGKTAELVQKYLSKGKLAYIEGRFQTRPWEKDGVKRYATEIVVNQIQFLSPKDGSSDNSGSTPPPPSDSDQPYQSEYSQCSFEDDIPF